MPRSSSKPEHVILLSTAKGKTQAQCQSCGAQSGRLSHVDALFWIGQHRKEVKAA